MIFLDDVVYFLGVAQMAHIGHNKANLSPDVMLVDYEHVHQFGDQIGEVDAFLDLVQRPCANVRNGPASLPSDRPLLVVEQLSKQV